MSEAPPSLRPPTSRVASIAIFEDGTVAWWCPFDGWTETTYGRSRTLGDAVLAVAANLVRVEHARAVTPYDLELLTDIVRHVALYRGDTELPAIEAAMRRGLELAIEDERQYAEARERRAAERAAKGPVS